ncbi:MAG: NADH-quinone oxidoreductase subunit L [Opitutaceae bacterium]|nr:NADH-quinone oxidoreductase subunit L [Opitutaceae bacterium]
MEQHQFAILVLVAPLVSATAIALMSRKQARMASIISVAAAAVVAVVGLKLTLEGNRFSWNAPWLEVGSFTLSIGFLFNDLSALMLAIVGIVGLAVHVFSLGYMRDDGAKARYFGGLSLFMFSMLGIVLANNLFMIFIFWELVGFSSYVLINHYHERQSAADASKKAFITNRVGDVGFMLGILWCYWSLGTVNLTEIGAAVQGGSVVATGIPLLLFCGAVGKSAQVPLQVWLPDAMEGPTPISALIHAATMVAAGIFMLCRIEPLFMAAPQALPVVMWIGTITALYAALCAIVQSDIKKVLAYSTLSQLGYMVAAFGLGSLHVAHGEGMPHMMVIAAGAGAAMFHLTTHAFFKALLFLGSGAVINACHHEQNIFRMGGLRKLSVTFFTFTTAVLAIIGMPGLAGFFSKDAILYLALANNRAVFAVLAVTAVLTAFYMIRMWKIVFLGEPRSDEARHAHEGGLSMTLPLIGLAILAVVGGYGIVYGRLAGDYQTLIPHAHGSDHVVILITSIAVLLIGSVAAYRYYPSADRDALAARSPGSFASLKLLNESFDGIYGYYIEKVQQRLAMLLNFLEQIFLSGLLVRGLAGIVGFLGMGTRSLHVGSVSAYAYWFLVGLVFLWGYAGGWF